MSKFTVTFAFCIVQFARMPVPLRENESKSRMNPSLPRRRVVTALNAR